MLKKELGLLGVFCIAAGAMISSGLFVLPGIAFAQAGPSIVLAYLLAGLLVIPALLAKAELATAMPKAGGSYFFVERSLGPMLGTVTGLLNWLSLALKAAFALVGIGALGLLLWPDIGEVGVKLIAIGGCLLFALVNLLSVKSAGRLQIILVFALLAILAAYVASGFGAVQPQRYVPFMPSGWPSVFAVTGMVFVSFGGLTKVAAVAEEVHDPRRNIPLGMFFAFAIVTLLYVLVVLITIGTVEGEQLSGSLTPITLGARSTMGRAGAVVVGLAGLLAFASTANAGILSASRSPMAMSKDGLLPWIFSRTNRRFGTPDVAVALTAGFMILVIAFLSVEDLVKTASTVMILIYGLDNVSVIVMRTSGIEGYRPSLRSPLLPWLQIATTVVYAFLIFEMGWVPLLLTGAFALVATLWYVGYVQRRIDRESAGVYLVKRITSKAIRRTGLEDELRRISIERDGVELDRFDRLVHDGPILDLEASMSAKEFFARVASELAPRLQTDPESLYERFLARERESSTVVEPGLAIPHVVVDGDHVFEILLARCRGGVVFSELHEPVTTAFVLVGSADERNYHLRALMIIAHILQEPEFRHRWLKARTVEQLRDIILLSSRKREGKA
jgi:amino acid transporter/mannitol/fructose-specific phosphotransferase system IIA component (Ntr-type)